MLDFVIFAVTTLVVLIATVIYLYPGSSKKSTTVPGLDPSDLRDGNLADISKAGSLHEFLVQLHDDYGDIASFWMGNQLIVSICSAKLFKEHSKVFDRPAFLYKLLEPLLTQHSIHYANKADGRMRRQLYDKCFTHQALPHYFQTWQKVADSLCRNMLSHAADEHVPLMKYMFAAAIKSILCTSFGDYFTKNEEVMAIRSAYDLCWLEMESRLDGHIPDEKDPRSKSFQKHKDTLCDIIKAAFDNRRKNTPQKGEELLIDLLIKSDQSESVILADSLTYLSSGFHTSGLLLTWAVYFLATHQDVQKKLVQELKDVLGNGEVTPSNVTQLIYMRQVLEETLRCSMVEPFAARVQDFDAELGAHKIPSGTPVIHALGVSMLDECMWPEPNKFDPDRFNTDIKDESKDHAFKPFGFSGKRQCPADKFSYAQASIVLATVLKKMTFHMVEGQVVVPKYGLVTKPSDEIWVTLKLRTK